jgi:inosine/xanthosine triphosphate pyrophosphatase family protein
VSVRHVPADPTFASSLDVRDLNQLLLASTNPAKLARLRWLVKGLPVTVQIPADFEPHLHLDLPEDGADFEENAAHKATGWSRAAGGMLTLSSDGGLRIPSLGAAWDELRTRRNSGADADNPTRIAHLLSLMRGKTGEERRAYWHEAAALAQNGLVLATWQASGDGGLIVEHYEPSASDTDFWTEAVRYIPAAGKLYRDLGDAEAAKLDVTWSTLRAKVHAFFEEAWPATKA